MQPTRATVRQLAQMIRQVERGSIGSDRPDRGAAVVASGWAPIDRALGGGLGRGAIHEWFGLAPPVTGEPTDPAVTSDSADPPARSPRRALRHYRWTPPLCVLTHLAWRAIGEAGEGAAAAGGAAGEAEKVERQPRRDPQRIAVGAGHGGRVVWVGRRCWPYGRVLVRPGGAGGEDRRLLHRSLFVDPPDASSRLWAIDLALRSAAVAVVVADATGLDIASTRRLQLAAEAGLQHGGGAIGLLTRPPSQTRHLSVAATRWRVRPASNSLPLGAGGLLCRPGEGRMGEGRTNEGQTVTGLLRKAPPPLREEEGEKTVDIAGDPPSPPWRGTVLRARPRWAVELLRCKGAGAVEASGPWGVEWSDEKGAVVVSADVVDRPDPASHAPPRWAATG